MNEAQCDPNASPQIDDAMVNKVLEATKQKLPPVQSNAEIEYHLNCVREIFMAEKQRTLKISASKLKSEIKSLLNNINSICERLTRHDYKPLRDAMEAALLELNVNAKQTFRVSTDATLLFEQTNRALSDLQTVVTHLQQRKREFDLADQAEQWTWFLKGPTHRAMYPFLRQHDRFTPERFIVVEYIASMYTWVFGLPFRLSSGKPPQRWSGPSVRFASAIIAELGLSKHFTKGGPQELANKIGDIWNNYKKTQGSKRS